MKFEIKNRFSGDLIVEVEAKNWRFAVELAIKQNADLSFANLSFAKYADHALAQTLIVPDGDLIVWKKCCNNVLVKLLIPKEAKRSNATGRKCRAEYGEVLELIDLTDKRKKALVGISHYKNSVEYRVGETVKCDEWDEDRLNECSGGIHFFITRIEAENYSL